MKDLIIYGSGGHAREMCAMVEEINEDRPTWNLHGFLDDNPKMRGAEVHGYPVLGGAEWLTRHPGTAAVIAIGSSPVRRRIAMQLTDLCHPDFATLVHPTAQVGRWTAIGSGSMIGAQCILTTDVRIGAHIVLNIGSTVSHDVVLEDFVTVAPGSHIAGNVQIGEGCDIGINSTIIQGISLGRWTILGAGAVVVNDLPANATAVGIPAKVIKERPEGWHQASSDLCGS